MTRRRKVVCLWLAILLLSLASLALLLSIKRLPPAQLFFHGSQSKQNKAAAPSPQAFNRETRANGPPLAPVDNQLPPAQSPPSGIFLPAAPALPSDPCGSRVTAQIGETPDAPEAQQSNRYGEEEGPFNYAPAPPPIPKPVLLPVSKSCENGALKIAVVTPRHFGYRLGMRIPITIEFTASPSALFDFSSLNSGVLAFDGSDFELTDEPPRVQWAIVGDKKIWHVSFFVQTWVPKKTLVLTADLRYALRFSADGHTPAWQVATTPDLVITTTQTLDGGTTLLDGDMNAAVPKRQKRALLIVFAGCALALLFPLIAAAKLLYRVTAGVRTLSPEEIAWNALDPLITTGIQSGFDQAACREIAVIVRRYFKVESALRSELERVLPEGGRLSVLERTLAACENTYSGSGTLTGEGASQLVSDLMVLIPRAWHDKASQR